MSRDHSQLTVVTFNDVPPVNYTLKYEVLGPMAVDNHRAYCERRGYGFTCEVPLARDRPACWAKIPALLEALDHSRWALWADSDTLITDPSLSLEPFLDDGYDLIFQSHEQFFSFIGVPLGAGLARMPINTGVFFVRSSTWSRRFLAEAYEQRRFVSEGEPWDGIGEQEAMTAVLLRNRNSWARVKYVTGLQNHPRFYRPGDCFLHFYGNHARHRVGLLECEEVIGRWGVAARRAGVLPEDRARFHWCCIQNKAPGLAPERGDLGRYLYRREDIEPDARRG